MTRPFDRSSGDEIAFRRAKVHRRGVAAVEFALCLPLIVLLMLGIWEVGRIVQVANILTGGTREAARDASLGQDNLQTIASYQLAYLQGALPNAFPPGHSTSRQSAVVALPANTTGYTYWDNTANRELFTITFADVTEASVTDPTGMRKLDHFQIGLQVPYATVGWTSLAQITGIKRISIVINYASMLDAPFQITPSLPAQ